MTLDSADGNAMGSRHRNFMFVSCFYLEQTVCDPLSHQMSLKHIQSVTH
jgi:hypothetical protein